MTSLVSPSEYNISETSSVQEVMVQKPIEIEGQESKDIYKIRPYRPCKTIVTDIDRQYESSNLLGELILKQLGTKKGKNWHHDSASNTIVIED